jgi:hypothetical protein
MSGGKARTVVTDRPGNQRPRKCDLKGRHTYVASQIGLFQAAVIETDSVAPTGQFSFLFRPRPEGLGSARHLAEMSKLQTQA